LTKGKKKNGRLERVLPSREKKNILKNPRILPLLKRRETGCQSKDSLLLRTKRERGRENPSKADPRRGP